MLLLLLLLLLLLASNAQQQYDRQLQGPALLTCSVGRTVLSSDRLSWSLLLQQAPVDT
jgi:hypothetical protein